MFHVESALVQQINELVVNGRRVCGDDVAVDSQKDVDNRERRAFVPLHERMVLNKALQKRSSLMDDGVVVAGSRTMKGRFERAGVSDAGRAAVTLDQLLVEEKGVGCSDVLRHLASDRYNSSRSLRLS